MILRNVRAALSKNIVIHFAKDCSYMLRYRSSYSQNGEDIFLMKEVFKDYSKPGTYLDIGASHPVRISNTYLFYRMGWSGVTVEPIPVLGRLHRLWRPRDTLVQAVIGQEEGLSEFHWLYPSDLSTCHEEIAKTSLTNGALIQGKLKIQQLTLKTLLDRYCVKKRIDLMNIDTEGGDIEIAAQISKLDRTLRPFAICIEGNTNDDKENIGKYLGKYYRNSYEIHVNKIFWSPV